MLSLIAVSGVAGAAQADPDCGTSATVPGVSFSYSSCNRSDSWWGPMWQTWAYGQNNHGAPAALNYQVNVRIDGADHILPVHSRTFTKGNSTWYPYSASDEWCTPQHTYSQWLRMKLPTSNSWGAWAKAPTVTC